VWRSAALLAVAAMGCGWAEGRAETQVLPAAPAWRQSIVGRVFWVWEPELRFVGVAQPPRASRADSESILATAKLSAELDGAAENGSAEASANLALARFAAGALDDAIRLLDEASRRDPKAAVIQADLGAALAQRALRDQRPEELGAAVEAFATSLAAQPTLAEARYNLAFVLATLHLDTPSRRQWDAYLALEPDGAWAERAHAYIGQLASAPADNWNAVRAGFLAVDAVHRDAVAHELVRTQPERARSLAEEELLGTWAAASNDGDLAAADRALELAGSVGLLVAAAGDSLLLETVDFLRAHALDDAKGSLLRRGHAEFAAGLAAEAQDHWQEAEAEMQKASAALGGAGSPFRPWAEVHVALCEYYRSDFPGAERRLRSVLDNAGPRHLSLVGRAWWLIGVIDSARGRFPQALDEQRRALALYEQLRETAHAGYLHALVAWDLHSLGEEADCWRHWMQSLTLLPRVREPKRVFSVLSQLAEVAENGGHLRLALFALDELTARLGETAEPVVLAEAHVRRARLAVLAGQQREVAGEAVRARQLAAAVGDGELRRRLEADIEMAEGLSRFAAEPTTANELLSRAMAYYDATGYRADTLELLTERSRVRLAGGDLPGALADLRTAVAEFEARRQEVPAGTERARYFELAQATFDELVALQLGRQGDARGAFDTSERSRARSLLDAGGKSASPRPLVELQPALPAGTLLVAYAQLDEGLATWWVDRRDFGFAWAVYPSDQLARRVAELRKEIAGSEGGAAAGPALREISRLLLTPVAAAMPAAKHVVFVPDKDLFMVPFAALIEPRSDDYLLKSHTVAVAPSASIFARTVEEEARRSRSGRLVMFTNSAFSHTCFPNLPALRGTDAEVAAMRAVRPDATIVAGEQATRSRFLAMAPEAEILQISGHAVVEPHNLESSALLFAPEGGDCGKLTAEGLYALSLPKTRLVILASCSTALGGAPGREGPMGLARAFLAVRVPAVVASLWPVDDARTAAMIGVLHRELAAGSDPLVALQRAQAALLNQRRPLRDWASLELIGAGMEMHAPRSSLLTSVLASTHEIGGVP
jgi:CHAT domain-containing protein